MKYFQIDVEFIKHYLEAPKVKTFNVYGIDEESARHYVMNHPWTKAFEEKYVKIVATREVSKDMHEISKNSDRKFFAVRVKCGHVGRDHYVERTYYVGAPDAKQAATLAKELPRVKRDHKDAILSVEEVTHEEFREGRARNAEDPYLAARNPQEVRVAITNEDLSKETRERMDEDARDRRKGVANKSVVDPSKKLKKPYVRERDRHDAQEEMREWQKDNLDDNLQ